MPTRSLALLLLVMASAVGCRAPQPGGELVVQPLGRGQYLARFETGYFATTDDNLLAEAVLVSDGTDLPDEPDPAAPLQPSARTPLRQVLHVQIVRRPLGELPVSNPAPPPVSNAWVDWYVFTSPFPGEGGVLHYSGSGMVDFRAQNQVARLRINDVTLTRQSPAGAGTVQRLSLDGVGRLLRAPDRIAKLTAELPADARNAAAARAADAAMPSSPGVPLQNGPVRSPPARSPSEP
ncbi:MAG: hypothetical protein ACFCVE_05645 [Phycisphaerae bacterium]